MNKLEAASIKEFNAWAKTYDNFFNHLFFSNSNRKISGFLPLDKKTLILDVGSGTGNLIELLIKRKDYKITGLDLSPEMVKISKNKFTKNKNVTIIEGSALKMPFKNNKFDLVTCLHSFHHHPNSLKSLREMYRVLKPGGTIIILDAFKDGIFRKIFCGIVELVEGKVFHYTKTELKNLFVKTSLTDISQTTFGCFHLITIGKKQ